MITAPFDAELFGHWWFEGVDFLAHLYRTLSQNGVRPVTAWQHVATGGPERPTIQLTEGSWGKDGNFSMWLNDQTVWTVAAALAARRRLLGRCAQGAGGRAQGACGAGAGHAVDASGAGVGLAVHHLHGRSG